MGKIRLQEDGGNLLATGVREAKGAMKSQHPQESHLPPPTLLTDEPHPLMVITPI